MNQGYKVASFGILAGLLSGLLGVGGGIILIPGMVGLFGVEQHVAHGTSLAVIVPTALISTIIYGMHGNLDIGLAVNLAVGSIVGASLGARLLTKVSALQLKRMLGIVMLLVGLRMVFS